VPASLISPETADRLTRACRTTVGDSLRSVTYFTRDDFEQVYLRDDLERDADLESFIGHEWYDFSNTRTAYEGSELGVYRYTIRAFDNGYLVRITTDHGGVFATTDGITIRDYEELVAAVRGVWDEE
jgi:hypothetical protein